MTSEAHNTGASLAQAHAGRFRVVPYAELRAKATALAGMILGAYGSDECGVVVAPILGGGGPPARLVVDALLGFGIVSGVVPCHIRRYEGVGQVGATEILLPLDEAQVAGKTVIGVDDMVDGGQTLKAFREHATAQGAAEVHTAVVFAKPTSIEEPDWVAEKGVTEWLVMPGEELDFMTQIAQNETDVGALSGGEQAAFFEALGFKNQTIADWTALRRLARSGVQ